MALAPTVSAAGISAPSYADILAELRTKFFSIYGSDSNLDPDSQDGQWLSVLAQGYYDAGQACVATYNAFSPSTAQGAGLSSVVKINGIRRNVPTNSQAVVTVTGQAGTIINGGIVGDDLNLNTRWALPPVVTVPLEGQISVTATATDIGAVAAGAGTLTVILTPTLGWQSVTNPAAAVMGEPVESDAALRRRQTISTTVPALSILETIDASLSNLDGVRQAIVYENKLDTTGANGIPSHSIAAVVSGGDVQEIADTIFNKKGPGVGTYGTTSATVIDQKGLANVISFFVLAEITVTVEVTIHELVGYVSTTGELIKTVIAGYLSTLPIGESVYLGRMYAPANLSGDAAIAASGMTQPQLDALSHTYTVTSILMSRSGPPVAADVGILFNEAATATTADISLVVT